MTTTHQVFVTEGVFGLLDGGVILAESADWSNGFVAPMEQGALIATGINTGYVRVTIQGSESQPADAFADGWEEVVEVSVHAPTGQLSVESLEMGPVADDSTLLSPAGPAWYRVRLSARGRELLRDKVSMEPVEDYLLATWPAPRADTAILRTSERIQRSLRAPQPGTAQPSVPSHDLNPPIRKP